jgi:diketogulonate reductase-like aldo/keto reductase
VLPGQIASAHGTSPVMVVLSWALQSGASVLPRSSKGPHIDELAKLLGEPGGETLATFLKTEELERIDSLEVQEE